MQYNKEFLLKLDKNRSKTTYAKITALNLEESPIESIEGKITQGSVNIDGVSAVRRTCSLTMISTDMDFQDYYWGLNTKFKLEIGLENFIDSRYPDIIWFNQGIYIVTSLSIARSVNNFTLTIQGKDKMCLLNGEVGGSLNSSIDFGCIEEESEDGIWTIRKIPIPDIIKNMIHQYGNEPYHNIIINDLDALGLELLEYRYDIPLYLYRKINSSIFSNVTLDESTLCYVDGSTSLTKFKDLPKNKLDPLVETLTGTNKPARITFPGVYEEGNSNKLQEFYVAKIEYGQTAGYRLTDLTFAGDLIANVGESITSVLDKIKNMLGEFEYFYDLHGRFVFQRKKSFVNTLWTPTKESMNENEDTELYVESLALASASVYTFSEGELITAFNNNPNLLNLRNDYSIWGTRKSASGTDIPVHLRYAIDKKPTFYRTVDGSTFYSTEKKTQAELEKIKEEIKQSIENGLKSYEKKKNPNGLPEEWWDIIDWATYYKQLTGETPPGTIGTYCKNEKGEKQYVKRGDIHLNDYFPAGTVWEDRDIYIFDVESDGTLGYVGHGIGCNHNYNYFLERALNNEGTSYIYKPIIPVVTYVKELDKLVEQEMLLRNYNCEWREIIYQMALDFYQHNEEDDFEINLRNQNYEYYPSGKTGYEQYYIDLQGFWRQLYNPYFDKERKKLEDKSVELQTVITECENKLAGILSLNKENEYKAKLDTAQTKLEIVSQKLIDLDEEKANFYLLPTDPDDRRYWNKDVFESPETLNFWFDFLDTEGELSQFSVKTIGPRAKSVNDTGVKSIYFRETPEVIFTQPDLSEDNTQDNGFTDYGAYKEIQVQDIDSMFSISAQGKSAKDRLDELIYQHGYCIETVTINSIPIYYLEPNIRIHVTDTETNINGDYVVSKISIPLQYNGTMSINATKAAESILY